jgi:hypothetical protein
MAVQGSQMSSVVGVPLGSVGRKVKDMPGKGTGPLLPPSDHRVTESPTADMEKCAEGGGVGGNCCGHLWDTESDSRHESWPRLQVIKVSPLPRGDQEAERGRKGEGQGPYSPVTRPSDLWPGPTCQNSATSWGPGVHTRACGGHTEW